MKSEATALMLSMLAALLMGVVGVVAAVITNSQAILLDGLFNACYFVTALFTLRVAQLLKRPDDAQFPFGYLYFEPLINAVKGLLILGVALFALIDAALTILAGGRDVAVGGAIGYAAFATALCLAMALLLRRARRHVASPLVNADVENWSVNAAISGAVFVAFGGAFVMIAADLREAARYVDPILVSLVILISIGVPVRMAGRALMALLNRAPPDEVVAPVAAIVRKALAGINAREIYVRVVQPGRTIYAVIHVLLEADHPPLAVQDADALRRDVVRALTEHHSPIIVDLLFTTEEQFAAPTTGFVAAPPSTQTAA
jgi:cation diffusion facilitator family transporter